MYCVKTGGGRTRTLCTLRRTEELYGYGSLQGLYERFLIINLTRGPDRIFKQKHHGRKSRDTVPLKGSFFQNIPGVKNFEMIFNFIYSLVNISMILKKFNIK